MFELVGDKKFMFRVKNKVYLFKFYLNWQGSKLSWQMQWLLNKLLDSSQKSVVCISCQKKIRFMLEKSDFIVRGKSLLCPECQSALWIKVGLFQPPPQFTFSQLFLTRNPEVKKEPAQK